jgi:spermidine synthase
VRLVLDDARHVVTTAKQKFDAITSDPLDPWVKGAAALYTKEFFEAARDHLNPGGVMTVFVQLYQSSPDAVKSEIATFFDVFPDGVIWANAVYGQAYDLVLYGQAGATSIDIDDLDARLRYPEYAAVARSLAEVGIVSAEDLLSTYSGRLRDLEPWFSDGAINRDRNLRLQYLAGLDVDIQQGSLIFGDMVQYRRFPDDLFVGSSARLWSLRAAIEQAKE